MAEKTLSVQPGIVLSDDAAALLELSLHDPLVGMGTLTAMIKSGRAKLFEVLDGAELVAAYVLQGNECEHGRELVVVAAGAHLPGYSVTRTIVPFIERQAGEGFERVRIMASRRGMVRVLAKLGYRSQATAMVKDLRHVL